LIIIKASLRLMEPMELTEIHVDINGSANLS